MNKGKVVIKNILSIITIILVAITSFSLTNVSKANTNNEQENNNTSTENRTFVRLEYKNDNKVDVYLEVAENTVTSENGEVKSSVSIEAFQIGLDIEIDLETEGSRINFDFADKLKDELSCETRKATKKDIIDSTTNKKIGERLNIYYVGNKDLNDSIDSENNTTKGIKIGTITFEGIKQIETASIKPNSEFTKIASVGHSLTETKILEKDELKEIIINPTTSEGESENQGEGSQGGSEEGSGDIEGEDSENENDGSGDNKDSESQENNENGANAKDPNTGDIGIKVFIILMIVSLLGIVLISIKKKTKQSK